MAFMKQLFILCLLVTAAAGADTSTTDTGNSSTVTADPSSKVTADDSSTVTANISTVTADPSSTVTADSSSTVTADNSSTVTADASTVTADSSSTVTADNSSTVTPDTSTVTPDSSSTVTPDSSSTVTPDSSSTVTADSSSTVTAESSSTVTPDSSSTVTPDSSSTVTPDSSSTVTPDSSSTVTPDSSSTVTADSSSTVTAESSSTVTADSSSTVTPDSSSTVTPDSSSTVTPDSSSTVTADSSSTVTADSSSTVTPDSSSTVTADSSSTVTADSSSTVTAGTSTNTSVTTEAPPTPGQCVSNSCPQDTVCEELIDSFLCVCRPGLFYDSDKKTCIRVKTFPNEITLNKTFEEDMKDKNSQNFKTTANDIVKALNDIFANNQEYIGSRVLSLSPGSVVADVDSIFKAVSNITEEMVQNVLNGNAYLNGSKVIVKPFCSRGFCDIRTTSCTSKDGFSVCICNSGHIKINATEQSCYACPSGYKAVSSNECGECPFGYSGFNCDEPYLLAVVIVSSVLGVLLLAALVTIIVLSLRSPLKKSTSEEDIVTFSDLKTVGFTRMPRAKHSSGWQPANLEPTDSGSRNSLVTRDQPENISLGKYYNAYNDDTRGYKSQGPSTSGNGNGYGSGTGYGNGNKYGYENGLGNGNWKGEYEDEDGYGNVHGKGNGYRNGYGYGYGNGARAVSRGPKHSKNPYYDPDDDTNY